MEKSRKSSVTAATADNKNKQVKRNKVVAAKSSDAEKSSKKPTEKSGPKKVSPKIAAKPLSESLSHNSAAKTSPRSPSKRKTQAKKSPVKKVPIKHEELIDPPKGVGEVDSAEVTAADLGLDLTDDGDGIEVELAKVEAEDLHEKKGDIVIKKEDTSR